MMLLKLIWSLTSLLLGLEMVQANEIVYILSGYGQLVTSSTLRWASTNSNEALKMNHNIVRAGKDSEVSICRGYFQNTLVPGSTNARNQCVAYFFEKVVFLEDYQVLIDKTMTSRYQWVPWDIFTKIPIGGVAFTEGVADATFISHDSDRHIGEIDPKRQLTGNMAVSLNGKKVSFAKKGAILQEIEPTSYELQHTQFINYRAKTQRKPVILGQATLSLKGQEEDEKEWQDVSSVVAFNASYSFYFGQLEGLIRALPSSGPTYSGEERYETIDFSWGLPLKFTRHRIQRVSATLMTGTSMDLSVEAMVTTTELPYESVLVSKYQDGQERRHNISGTYQETLLTNVQVVEIGVPYFIQNGSAAPTTTTTTTTTTTSSTTTVLISTTKVNPTELWTLRPKRTTTPLPTEENPLLRFYPLEEEEEENEEINFDQASRSRMEMSDQFYAAAAGSEKPQMFGPISFLLLLFLICQNKVQL